MGEDQRLRSRTTTWRVLLAILCVVLAIVAGTAQVVHTHADGTDTHADCSLCAAAHVTVQTVQTPVLARPVAVTFVFEPRPQPRPASRLFDFALFTRPPPAV